LLPPPILNAYRYREQWVKIRRLGQSGLVFDSDELLGWALLRTGKNPVGLVMGSCVYAVTFRGPVGTFNQALRNVELPLYTQALYDARELAMTRMQREAADLSADGIVGVELGDGRRTQAQTVIVLD
jgi:uncharacterized protein YbjQ (UPF0145 family)